MVISNNFIRVEVTTTKRVETIAGFDHLEQVLSALQLPLKSRKKILFVVGECLHNIIHHRTTAADKGESTLTVSVEDDRFVISSTNLIDSSGIPALKASIDHVRSLSPRNLRSSFLDKLSTGKWSAKGTAGLGLLSIARRTDQKIRYSFNSVNDTQSHFNFQAVVCHI